MNDGKKSGKQTKNESKKEKGRQRQIHRYSIKRKEIENK